MRKNRKSPYFENINFVLDGLSRELGLEKGLKISSISNLWPKIVGPRFEKTSRIYSIQEKRGVDVVSVAVSSSSVAQELSFYKNDILKKLYKIGENFGFEIKDINFSTKYWKKEEQKTEKPNNMPSDEDLEQIEIPYSLLTSVKASLDEKSMFDDEMRARFLKTIIKNLKTQIWMKDNNFPVCAKCGVCFAGNGSESETLCPACKY